MATVVTVESGNTVTVGFATSPDVYTIEVGSGVQGPQGSAGANGVGITAANVISGNLVLTLSNTATIDAGNVVGPTGANGAAANTADFTFSGNSISADEVLIQSNDGDLTLLSDSDIFANVTNKTFVIQSDTGNWTFNGADGGLATPGKIQTPSNIDFLYDGGFGTFPYFGWTITDSDTLKLRVNIGGDQLNSDVITIDRSTRTATFANTVTVGPNVSINTSAIFIGNSTANVLITTSGKLNVSGNTFIDGPLTVDNIASLGNTTVTGLLEIQGDLLTDGSTVLGDNVSVHIVSFKSTVNTEFTPSANNQYDLGRSDLRWGNVYVGNAVMVGSNIFMNTTTISVGNSTVNTQIISGNIVLNGSTLTVGNSTVNTVVNSSIVSTGNLTLSGITATGNVTVNGNLTVGGTLVNSIYLLEAYASVTYTLPGSFTEDVCRYSVVSSNVNVSSSWFDTSTYTFTPQKAGYWEITASYDVYRNAEASMVIKKNGSIVASAGSFNSVAQQITKIVYLNGSTDYINIYNYGGAALSRSQYAERSWFQARWVG